MPEVASAFVTLVPSFKGGSRAISNELGGSVDRAGKDSGRRFGGGMATGLGAVASKVFAPLAAVAAGAGLASFFGDSIKAASDLNEATTKTQAIFGKAGAAAVQAFAGKGANALGQTKLDVINAAATFGTFGKAAGKSGTDLAKFSTGFTSLSTDLASFYNTSPEQAVEAIGAALRGEAEPIRQYGVLLDDATLRQEALKLGLIKTTKQALTPQQKVLAAQAAIYRQTKDAQGDFTKTSGGLANQQRILSAQFSDFKTTVGNALLPVVTKFVTFLNTSLVPAFGKVSDFVRPVVDALGKVGKAFFYLFADGADGSQSFGELIDNVFGNTGAFVEPLVQVGDAIKSVVAFVGSLFEKFKSGASAGGGIASTFRTIATFVQTKFVPALLGVYSAVRGFLTVAIPIVQQFVAGMRARIEPLLPTIRKIFGQIGTVIVQAMGLIKVVIQTVTAVVGYIWGRWGTQIMDVISFVWGAVVGVVSGALQVISGIIKTVTSILTGDWSGAWEGIKDIVSGAFAIIKSTIGAALRIAVTLFSVAFDAIGGVLSSAWGFIKDGAANGVRILVDFVKSIPGRTLDALGNLGSLLLEKGKALVQGLIDGITSKIKAVGDAAGKIAQKVKDFFPGSPVKTGPLTAWNNGGAGLRLGEMLAGGLEASTGSVRAASARLAASVHSPTATPGGAGGYGSLSQSATVQMLTAALERANLSASISAGQLDAAMGRSLR